MTVSVTGLGTAIAVGETDICATYQGETGCLRLTVSADSISLVTIAPLDGTTLSPGQVVSFTATVSYELDSADSGRIGMNIQDQTNANIQSNLPINVAISRGSGMVTLSDVVTIPAGGVTTVNVFLPLFPAGQSSTSVVVLASYPVQPATSISERLDSLRGMAGNLRCVLESNGARVLTSCVGSP